MFKYAFIAALLSSLLIGCSAKEFNSGVDGVTSDIKNAFEGSKDKSAR